MDIRLVALDLDGTTLSPDGAISDENIRSIREASERGVNVVISTGRVESALPDCVKNIDSIRYAITSNGSRITDLRTGECIHGDYLSRNALYRAIEIARDRNITIEAFYNGLAYIDRSLYDEIERNGCEYRNREYVLKTRIPCDDIYDRMYAHEDIIENINFFFPTPEILETYRDEIEAIPDAMITMSFPVNLEVGGPDTSKKKAIEVLMNMLGFDRSQVMCIGDAPNDIEMIKFAGIGVAMGNAWGKTTEYADYITDDNSHDGVAKAIDRFVLGR